MPMGKDFKTKVIEITALPLTALDVSVLQVNLGYLCTMACRHCHVDAGPARTEVMSLDTIDHVLAVLAASGIATLDITGGAPEMNPHFTYLVTEARKRGCHVVVRSNLTILTEPGFGHLPDFFRDHAIEITASLPYYLADGVDRVRGSGTFGKSIEAVRRLNSLGFGDGTGSLKLNLVHNPGGVFLAPEQKTLESEYRRELAARHGVSFDNLFVFSNMPVGRFRTHLVRTGMLEKYLSKLEQAFNPATLNSLMCRRLVSVGWDGSLFDCDFNLALGLGLPPSYPQHIREFDVSSLRNREVRTAEHCYGCTAGQGST